MKTSKEKRDNFKRIAERRTNNVLEQIHKFENFANEYYYEYTEEDLSTITSAILGELKNVMDKLRGVKK